jgi:hypothetical protein
MSLAKICLILSFSGFPLQLIAQGVLTEGGAIKNIQFKDAGGKLLPLGQNDILGSPYIFEKFGIGKIIFSNGMIATDSTFNFSLFDQQLYFTKNNNLFLVNQPMKEFIIEGLDSQNIYTKKLFAAGFPAIESNTQNTLYEIITTGKSLQLLKHNQKRIKETTGYGAAPQKEYVTDYAYFIFEAVANKLVYLGSQLSIKSFKKALPHMSKKVDEMTEINKLNSRTEQGVIALVTLLNAAEK